MILYNGVYLPNDEVRISYEDRGFYFGDGIYEVFRVYGGQIYEKAAHLSRLQRSAQEIRIMLPYELDEIDLMVEKLKQKEQIHDGTIYLQITRGIAPRSHLFPQHASPTLIAWCNAVERPVQAMKQGITAVTAPDIRWLRCDVKTLNLLPNTMAKQQAADAGVEETIMHRDGIVTECSAANIMLVKSGLIRTHPANHLILHGITREVVLRLARKLNMTVEESPFTVDEMRQADELFITGTTVEITPVIAVDNQAIGRREPGPVTRRLQEAFHKTIG